MNGWMDITRPIFAGMPVWPGDPPIDVQRLSSVEDGAISNVSRWHLGTHTGTHVDPPRHFIARAATVLEMPLDSLCGEAFVVDARGIRPHVSTRDLEAVVPSGVRRVLLQTDNSLADENVFHEDFVALTNDAADWLVSRGVLAIGVDGPSIEPFSSADYHVHYTVLGAGIAVIEGLRLNGVEPGRYEMVCAPLPLTDADGAPARVLIRKAKSAEL